MHRRQLLARVMTTGLVLVGGAMSSSAVDVIILIKARDEASVVLRQVEAARASLGQSVERSLERWGQAFLASQRNRETLRSRGYRVGKNVDGSVYVGPPYIVGEHGPELFTPAGKPRTDLDYESLADSIKRAIQEMPPLSAVRVSSGVA